MKSSSVNQDITLGVNLLHLRLQPIRGQRLVDASNWDAGPYGYQKYTALSSDHRRVWMKLERYLKEVPSVKERSPVFADRIVGKLNLEINIAENKSSRYGMNVVRCGRTFKLRTLLGGMRIEATISTKVVNAYPIRVP